MNSSGGWPTPPMSPRSPVSVTFEDQARPLQLQPQSSQPASQQPRKDYKGRRIHFHDDRDSGGGAADGCRRRRRQPRASCCPRLLKLIIETRCTEQVNWTLSAGIGFMALAMQVPPIVLGDWVHIYEPRAINRTDEKGDAIELPFYFNLGYFRACRWALANVSIELATIVDRDFPQRCVWNSILTGEDLTDFSFTSNAILVRLGPSAFFHTVGSALTMMAFALSVNGHVRKNAKTLCSAIVYFIGGLSVMGGVLQLICVVDDEMYPRMRPTPSGEPSRFYFRYGLTFLLAAFSFLPIQICIYLQTNAFFNRFPEPKQKATIVPGLNKLLQQVSLIPARTHQLGRFAIMPAGTAPTTTATGDVLAPDDSIAGQGALSASVSAASSLSAGGVGGSVGTRRRESRISSRDLSGLGSPWTVHQEVRNADILTAYAIRRPSSQLYLA